MTKNSSKNVEIYTLDYCPYCQKAKIFFSEHNVPYNEIQCEDDEDNKRVELKEKFNLKDLATFPQIVIDGVHIGGYSDLIEKYTNNEIAFD